MASTQARMGQQALALLDVILRVPCIFIIDAIFNSYYEPGSGWAGAMGKVLVRVLGKHLKRRRSLHRVEDTADRQLAH